MDTAMSNWAFQAMSLMFQVRDALSPRSAILDEVGIEPGDRVLDYGCGPGAYVPDLSHIVGASGRVYALDMHPLAIRSVQRLARRRGLSNVETIHSDCQTGLPNGSLDIVLLYDVYHGLGEPDAVLAELHRVLKAGGVLSVLDPHIDEAAIQSGIAQGGLFQLAGVDGRAYRFTKRGPDGA